MKVILLGRGQVILKVMVLLTEITSLFPIVTAILLEREHLSAIHRMFLIPMEPQKVLLMDRLLEIPRVQVPEIPTIFHSARHWGAA